MAPKRKSPDAWNAGNIQSYLRAKAWNENAKKKRQRSNSDTVDDSKPAEKRQKSSPPPETDAGTTSESTKSMEPKKDNKSGNSTLTLTDHTGDIFAAPANTLIIHACNCQGSWSAGIAAAFRKNYPEAFKLYAKHCGKYSADQLLGTALLIPPVEDSSTGTGTVGAPRIGAKTAKSKAEKHFVGCLFTSNFYGKRKDSPEKILSQTGLAMEDLVRQVREWNERNPGDEDKIGQVRICKINSGLFAVPWEDTVGVLEGIEVDDDDVAKEVQVWGREE